MGNLPTSFSSIFGIEAVRNRYYAWVTSYIHLHEKPLNVISVATAN